LRWALHVAYVCCNAGYAVCCCDSGVGSDHLVPQGLCSAVLYKIEIQ
jgi:hypothetical protein